MEQTQCTSGTKYPRAKKTKKTNPHSQKKAEGWTSLGRPNEDSAEGRGTTKKQRGRSEGPESDKRSDTKRQITLIMPSEKDGKVSATD